MATKPVELDILIVVEQLLLCRPVEELLEEEGKEFFADSTHVDPLFVLELDHKRNLERISPVAFRHIELVQPDDQVVDDARSIYQEDKLLTGRSSLCHGWPYLPKVPVRQVDRSHSF